MITILKSCCAFYFGMQQTSLYGGIELNTKECVSFGHKLGHEVQSGLGYCMKCGILIKKGFDY